jgi:hypothetical protein
VVAIALSDMDVLVLVVVVVAAGVTMGLQSCKVKSHVGSALIKRRIRGCEAFQAQAGVPVDTNRSGEPVAG